MARVGAVILGAGLSTRMGSAKQLLPLGHETILERVVDVVKASKADPIVLVVGASAALIQEKVNKRNKVRVVVNEQYILGISTSVKKGIQSLMDDEVDGALVILGDQPFITPAFIDSVIQKYETLRAPLVVPMLRGEQRNPVLFDKTLFDELLDLDGDEGAKKVVDKYIEKSVKVESDDERLFVDIDTPEELVHAMRSQERS